MSLIFIDGFDHYDPQADDGTGQPWLSRGKSDFLNPQASRIAGRRPSSYALRLPGGDGGGYVKVLPAPMTSLIVGAALRLGGYASVNTPTLFCIRTAGGSSQYGYALELTPEGLLRTTISSNGYASYSFISQDSRGRLPVRGWHYVEFKVIQHESIGVLQARVNGQLVIDLSGIPTLLSGSGQLLSVFVGSNPSQSTGVTVDVDDLYIANTAGPFNNDFLGDVRVDVLQPQANGSFNQWSVEGAASAWQAVSDGLDATGVRAASVGLAQTFYMQALPAMASPAVHGVQVAALARKTDAGSAALRLRAVSGAQIASSADIALQEQLAWHTAMFEANLNDGTQWTESAVNAAEFGVES